MIESSIAYLLLLVTLVFFAWLGYRESVGKELDNDEFLSARGSQNWVMIGLSLFASGMGVWILFGPSEVGYYGGFYDVIGYDFEMKHITIPEFAKGGSITSHPSF